MAEEKKVPAVDYSKKNVLQKLVEARLMFLNSGASKSGKNMHLEFQYFELEDIVPVAEKAFHDVGLLMVPTFGDDIAVARVYNVDNLEESPLEFEMPFPQIQPIVSNSGKAVTNEMQALGASITYMRRYLWMVVMDIVEADTFDAMSSDDEAKTAPKSAPKSTKAKIAPTTKAKPTAPMTPADRKEIKKELTGTKNQSGIDDLQQQKLKAAIKNLLTIDPKMDEKVQKMAMETRGFTALTHDQADQLIAQIGELIKTYNK